MVNKLSNNANVVYAGSTVNSNIVETLLLLPPTLLKSVDKATANIGDELTYTCIVTNIALTAINDIQFSDTLPAGCTFKTGSFKVDTAVVTPTVTGNTLTYTLTQLATGLVSTIEFKVTVTG